MRKRFSADQWTAWMLEFERSGLSVTEFCRHFKVNQKSFYRWRKKLRDDSARQFVSVDLSSLSQVAINQVSIELPCGAIVRVDNQHESLQPVLQTLLQLGASDE